MYSFRNQRLKGAVSGFFQAIMNQDGGAVAEAILGLDVKGRNERRPLKRKGKIGESGKIERQDG
jgi:hypothetical protein